MSDLEFLLGGEVLLVRGLAALWLKTRGRSRSNSI
jgi:hypothetical protein